MCQQNRGFSSHKFFYRKSGWHNYRISREGRPLNNKNKRQKKKDEGYERPRKWAQPFGYKKISSPIEFKTLKYFRRFEIIAEIKFHPELLEQRRIPTVTSREVKSGPVWRKNTPHDAPPTQKFCFDRFHHIFFSKKSLIFSQNCQKKKKKVFSRIKIFREYVAVGCGFRRFLNRKETNPGPFFFLSSYTH